MSFGFGVGDFIAVSKIAKGVYEACKDGPREYREISREAKSMRYAIDSLSNEAQDPLSLLNTKGVKRKPKLVEIIENCETTMQEVQNMIDKHSSLKDDRGKLIRVWDAYKVGSSDLDSLRGKLTFHTSIISIFLLSLEGSALARIEWKVDKIYARMLQDDITQAQQSSISLASTTSFLSQLDTNEDDVWTILKTELLAEDISMAHTMSNKEDIIEYIKSLIAAGLPNGAIEVRPQREPQIAIDERGARLIAVHECLEQLSENGGQSENVEQNKRQEKQIRHFVERAARECEELQLTVERAKRSREENEVELRISLVRFKESASHRATRGGPYGRLQ